MTTQNNQITDLSTLSQEQLIELIQQQQSQIQTLTNKPDRKNQILTLLQQRPYTIQQLSDLANTTPKNISSILTYLRKSNITLITNPYQYKFILKHPYTDPETSEPIDPLTFKD